MALAYYYLGVGGNMYERLGAGVILGCSLLTARGIPCSGEADLKNCQAMKIMDLLGAGGSYTELYAMDFRERFILMGHDGPFHLAIAEGRPILREASDSIMANRASASAWKPACAKVPSQFWALPKPSMAG